MINTFIISYNRLSFLKQQIEVLSNNPMLKLHIVDNASTYPPLLEYLKTLHNCTIHRMIKNEGHKVVWETGISVKICPYDPYIVTDPDIIPEDFNFDEVLLNGLNKFPSINKIGLGFRMEDIPIDNPLRDNILKHENELQREYIRDPEFVRMPVDTTMAIYRGGYHHYSVNGTTSEKDNVCRSLRTTNCMAKHLSWHITEEEIKNEENQFYFESLKQGSTHWSKIQSSNFLKTT